MIRRWSRKATTSTAVADKTKTATISPLRWYGCFVLLENNAGT